MMAVETFVYLCIIGFGLATVLAGSLLKAAARMITRPDRGRGYTNWSSRHAAHKKSGVDCMVCP